MLVLVPISRAYPVAGRAGVFQPPRRAARAAGRLRRVTLFSCQALCELRRLVFCAIPAGSNSHLLLFSFRPVAGATLKRLHLGSNGIVALDGSVQATGGHAQKIRPFVPSIAHGEDKLNCATHSALPADCRALYVVRFGFSGPSIAQE